LVFLFFLLTSLKLAAIMRQTSQEIVLDKSQTRCEAGTESHGSLRIKIAGLPGNGWPGFFLESREVAIKRTSIKASAGVKP
jgi:hypothetical protein